MGAATVEKPSGVTAGSDDMEAVREQAEFTREYIEVFLRQCAQLGLGAVPRPDPEKVAAAVNAVAERITKAAQDNKGTLLDITSAFRDFGAGVAGLGGVV